MIKEQLDALPKDARARIMYAFTNNIHHVEKLANGQLLAVHVGDTDRRFTIVETTGKWAIVIPKEVRK